MNATLTFYSFFSIAVLLVVYFLLITEKINKVIVAMLGAMLLTLAQVFRTDVASSQEVAFQFIGKNLDVIFFIIGMMILVGIAKSSGFFEAIAIWLAKKVKGHPVYLLIAISYLTLLMTVFLSNVPTVLIMLPVLLILIKELKLPAFPYIFAVIVMANIGGAVTPISDPTTYYQAKTVGLGFFEVVANSGLIVLVLSVVSLLYTYFVFRKPLKKVEVKQEEVANFNPAAAIKDRKVLYIGIPLLFAAILCMVFKDAIAHLFGIQLDNASIVTFAAFLAVLIFNRDVKEVFKELVDWEILLFFMGLFIVVGSLDQTHVVTALANGLVTLSHGDNIILRFLVTIGSGILSVFIDNVPYNITMVSAIQAMAIKGIYVYPLWWALNLGTSLGGAGSPIGAACNVVALGQAEKEKVHVTFLKYLGVGVPLVLINGLIAFLIIWARY